MCVCMCVSVCVCECVLRIYSYISKSNICNSFLVTEGACLHLVHMRRMMKKLMQFMTP